MLEFQGRTYYRDKASGYYKTNAKHADRQYLHRDVYRSVYGNIPHGWHVHHKDEDRDNNDITNLECLPMREHVHKRHAALRRTICIECGASVTAQSRYALYCSNACALRHTRRRKKYG